MPENHGCPNLFLPNHWSRHVKSALCQAADARQRQAWRPHRTRRQVRGGTQASARRHAETCGLTILALANRSGPWSRCAIMPESCFQRAELGVRTHATSTRIGPESAKALFLPRAAPNTWRTQFRWSTSAGAESLNTTAQHNRLGFAYVL